MNKQFFKTDLAYQNWKSKYQYGNETPLESMIRAAKALASVETDKQDYWYARFLNTLVKFEGYEDNLENYSPEEQDVVKLYGKPVGLKTTLGGRILANIGTEYSGATLLNCFINGPVTNAKITYQRKVPNLGYDFNVEKQTQDNPDSLANIMLTLLEQAETLKSEGGWGINFDWIRPRGSLIEGIGIEHPGVIKYMEIFDKVSEVIVQGNNDGYLDKLTNYLETDIKTAQRIGKKVKKMARKGAMMGVLSIWHPDIEEFVRAKQTFGRLTKFNISVMVDDKFMHAVKNDDYYNLHFNGEVYKRVKALDLYNLIMESTYNRAEPGVLFYDNMQKNNPLAYLGSLNATNPCFTADNYLFTENGISTFGDLYQKNSILNVLQDKRITSESEETFIVNNNESGTRTTETQSPVVLTQENAEVIKINFNNGTFLRLTPNHRLFTNEGTIYAKDVQVGTQILAKAVEFINPNNNKHELDDLAFLLGLIDGDGCVVENKEHKIVNIDLWGDDVNYLAPVIQEKIEKLFNKYGEEISKLRNRNLSAYYVSKPQKVNKVRIGSSFLYHLLKYKFNWEGKKNIPKLILENTRNNNLFTNYFAGLFITDGTINDRKTKISSSSLRIAQSDKAYLNVIQTALASIGVHSSVYLRRKAGVKMMPDGKGSSKLYAFKDQYELIIPQNSFKNVHSLINNIQHTKISLLNALSLHNQTNHRQPYVTVTSIEKQQNENVYCLKEDNYRTIIVNNVSATRCGEIGGNPLTSTVCLLGSINLTQYVKPDRTFDFESYTRDIETFARMLDNVNDLTYAPLPQYEWATKNVRQYGMGINGFASALYMMGIPYSSEQATEFADRVTWLKEEWTWRTSALLAKEKSPFPAYRKDDFENTYWFTTFTNISDHTKSLLKMYGARNGKTTTNPPLGNSSVISDNISNGLEPVFSKQYTRTYIAEKWPEGLTVDNVKTILDEIKVGDATAWQGSYAGETYYYEPHNRGLCKIELVRDYGYEWVINNYVAEQSADYLETAETLAVDDHVRIQEVFQRNCNQSISKTVNVPFEYSFNNFKNAYMSAWERGLNGFTTYRSGTMEAVLTAVEENKEDNISQVEQVVKKDIKLPDEFLNGPMKVIKKEGKKFYLNFSYLPEDVNLDFPIALWIQTNSDGEVRQANQAVKKLADLLRKYEISEELIDKQIEKIKGNPAHMRLGKMVSMCLRHNLPLSSIVAALNSLDEVYVTDLLFAVKKFLSEHIEDGTIITGMVCPVCGSTNIVFQSGCFVCLDCGFSGCG